MFFSRATQGVLSNRLDAESYNPDFLAAAVTLSSSGLRVRTVEELSSKLRCGPFGSSLHASEYVETGVPFLSPTAFSGGEINVQAIARISRGDHLRLSGTSFMPPALVFARVGYPHCAVVSERIGEFNIHGDVIGLLPNDDTDPRYLHAFFASKHGGALLKQSQAGTTRPRINTPNLGCIPVAFPSLHAQNYIGSKVRQAEALRERGRRELERIRQLHVSLFPIPVSMKTERGSHHRVHASNLRDVLTADAYPPSLSAFYGEIRSKPLSQLTTAIYSGSTRPSIAADANEWVEQATCRSCSGTFIKRPCNRVSPPRSKERFLSPFDILVTNAAHDKAYIGKDYTFYHGGPPNFPSTKVMVIRVDRKQLPASYVHIFLTTPIGYIQTQAVVRGITAGISPTDIGEIKIPLPARLHIDYDEWLRTDHDLKEAAIAVESAMLLTQAARLLVEALIERKVSEADLIAANHDPAADRALLARLTTKGLDAGGERLFSDIDALASLLEVPAEGGLS